eukprot:PITA_15993
MIDTPEASSKEIEVEIQEIAVKLERLSLTPTPSPSLVVSEPSTDIELNLRSRRRMAFRVGRGRGRGGRGRLVANVEIMESIEELPWNQLVPVYQGGLNPEELIEWINNMEKFFDYEEMEDEKKVKFAITKLIGHATLWWDGVQAERRRLGKKPIKNWRRMVAMLKRKLLPNNYQQTLFRQMQNLRQRALTVKEYKKEFYKVSIRAGEAQNTDGKVARYMNGLRMDIQDEISLLSPKTVEESYQIALKAEEKLMRKQSARGRGTFRGKESQGGSGRYTTPKGGASSSSTQHAPTGGDTRAEGEAPVAAVTKEVNTEERGESLVLNKVLLKPAKEMAEPPQRKDLFVTMCKVQGKCCQMIIDSGNTDNLVSTEVVEKLKLKTMKHATPYKVSWLKKGHQLLVSE